MTDAMISLQSVSKKFSSGSVAVRELSIDVNEGETVVLVGPSGCGKTTTLKMINRLIEPSDGSIVVNGTDVLKQNPVELRRSIGYVIQSVGLMPHRSIADNIATVPNLLGWEGERTSKRVEELRAVFELDDDLLQRYPGELSGGQRQRVGVARALAADPPVMLMDEPFGAVDPIVRGRLQEQFLSIQRELRKTIVFVTHDVDEAVKLADRIVILNVGGVLEQYDTPAEILASPANDFVRDFIGPERGLKRLALISVDEIEAEDGPIVTPGASAQDALHMIEKFDYGWTSVVDDGELIGWIEARDLKGKESVSEVEPRRFSAHVTPDSSLRQALDSVVTSRTQVAVVLSEGQRFSGILTLERISKEILS